MRISRLLKRLVAVGLLIGQLAMFIVVCSGRGWKMKLEIEIKPDDIVAEIKERLITRYVDYYFDCEDMPYKDYDEREAEKKARVKAIIDSVDWARAPEYFSSTVIRKFFDKLIDRDMR